LTSLMVVLGGETRDYWYTRGFFVRGTVPVYAGVFESAGGTAVNCVDERPTLGWTHDASP
jgi:hypothetical protein